MSANTLTIGRREFTLGAQVMSIAANQRVSMVSSNSNAHDHTVTFN